jgi:hypothetical protein
LGKKINLEGKRFGRWRVVGQPIGKRHPGCGKRELLWPCVCDCGTGEGDPIYVYGHSLRKGTSNSCGCFRNEKVYNGGEGLRSDTTKDKIIGNSDVKKKRSDLGLPRQHVVIRKSKSKLRICKICGRQLSGYNTTGKCFSHAVADPYQNKAWEPHGHGSGIQGEERKPISEHATTSISAAAGKWS